MRLSRLLPLWVPGSLVLLMLINTACGDDEDEAAAEEARRRKELTASTAFVPSEPSAQPPPGATGPYNGPGPNPDDPDPPPPPPPDAGTDARDAADQ